MLVSREDVLKFIPQRPPIVVVHGLIEHSESSSTSVFQVEEDHLFTRDGKFLPSGLMENIAQTAALRSGYHFAERMKKGGIHKNPPIGFIGSLKNFLVSELPATGLTLNTTVTILHEVMGMQVVEAKVEVEGSAIATCEMKIFLSDES
jgi:predicted acyltransferase